MRDEDKIMGEDKGFCMRSDLVWVPVGAVWP